MKPHCKVYARLYVLTAVVLVSIMGFFLWIGGYFITEKRNTYLIPKGYTGYACINYGVMNAPPLPVDQAGFHVVMFPKSGILQTSSLGKPGPLVDKYFYYDDNLMSEVPASHIGGGGTYTDYPTAPAGHYAFYFWVSPSPNKDYERAGRLSSEILRGKCF